MVMIKEISKLLKLNLYIFLRNYNRITTMISNNPNLLNYLNDGELLVLADYALKHLNHKLLTYLSDYTYERFDDETKYKIIEARFIKCSGRNIKYTSFFEKHFEDCFLLGTNKGNIFFLVNVAIAASKEPEKYKYEIEVLKDIFTTSKVDFPTIKVANLPSFESKKLDNVIMASNFSNSLMFIKESSNKKALELLKTILKSGVLRSDYEELRDEFKRRNLSKEFNLTIKSLINRNLKSSYLLWEYELSHDEDLAKFIILLGDHNSVSSLMSISDTKKQNDYIKWVMNEELEDTYLVLLSSTTCSNTYCLIDYFIKKGNNNDLVLVLGLLHEEYLEYALKNIINANYNINSILNRMLVLDIENAYLIDYYLKNNTLEDFNSNLNVNKKTNNK